jgi:hypothetical protein
MLKLFHVLDLPKSGVVVMQLFVCGCVSYAWSAMLCQHQLGSNMVTLKSSWLKYGVDICHGKSSGRHRKRKKQNECR